MSKQRINITVDHDLYMISKVRLSHGDLSRRINDFLRDFLEAQEAQGEESEILEELQELQAQRREIQEKIATASVKLSQIRQQKEAVEKETEERERMIRQMDDQSGILRDLEMN